MRHCKLSFLSICLCALTTFGQPHKSDSVLTKISTFKKLLTRADTLTPAESLGYNTDFSEQIDSGFDINEIIANQLSEILSVPNIMNYNLDSLLRHDFLGITHSEDKLIWIFYWYSNNGGTWQINSNVVYHRTKSSHPKIYIDLGAEDAAGVCSMGGWFGKIYKLKASSRNLYLCLGSAHGCSTCCSEFATVIEIINDSVNFNYPAFIEDDKNFSPCYALDSRCGDIEKFEYDSNTQTISYVYAADDNTPIKDERLSDNILFPSPLKDEKRKKNKRGNSF